MSASKHHSFRHGKVKTGAYNSYTYARARCNNPNRENYKWYGGRGIKFLFKSFLEFYAELGDRPNGMTLDRKDTNGHYESGNVKWSTQKYQCKTRRVRCDARILSA